ncbi:MAG TPA: methylenetetrahydrofolate reductase [NAD(P)H] [Lachnospiraceae bacterium]|jgi:methylenetetrahydrofolate reductase (NADPH)|nr:methylenetetrahydrofolate reductase [NAD(P)H] [Lachnospiraceae bacterium]
MKIKDIFAQKKPVVSFEIFPPKKEEAFKNIDELLEKLSVYQPDFISVTFGAGGTSTTTADGKVKNPTVEIAQKIKNVHGMEAVAHLSCLNYDKAEVDGMLLALKEAGIENILALRGDINPDVERKYDFKYASDLVQYIKEHGDFGISGACYPEVHPECSDMKTDIVNLKKKVDAGATHLVSQLFFDNAHFYDFVKKAREAGITVPIEAGIMPVTNKSQIERMVTMCGATLPDKFKVILDKYENDDAALLDAGIAYAINQIVDLIAHDVDGIHIYVMNKPEVARRICEAIGAIRTN